MDVLDLDKNRTAVHPICEAFFRRYQAEHGRGPGRNVMWKALAGHGIPRAQIRSDWHTLTEHAMNSEGDPDMPNTSTSSPPAADLTTKVEQLEAHNADLRVQLLLVRDQLGKASARIASQERALIETERHVQGLIQQANGHEAEVKIVREFRDLVTKDDEAWDALLQMVRAASVTSKFKPLLRWCARLTGRALGHNDLLQP
jgi:hypothetical protein